MKDRDEPNDREQFTRSNAPTARLPTLARMAQTLTRDWLNTNEPREMVMPTITYIINWQTATLTGQMSTTSSAFTKDLSTTETKPTNRLLTDHLTWNKWTKNRPIWLTIDGSKSTNDWWHTLHESFSYWKPGLTLNIFLWMNLEGSNSLDWQARFEFRTAKHTTANIRCKPRENLFW